MIRAMNLARLGEENVERFGEYVSLAFEDREYTNVEQQRAASRLAHALTRLGVAEGDRVVVMLPNCPEVLQAYAAKMEGWPGTVIMVGGGGSGLAYDDLVAAESDRFARERGDADLAVILYTAGTTGRPKGVALSHGNLAANARAAASLYEMDRTQWALAVLPLSHSYGLTMMNAGNLLGTRSVLLRWFNPELVLETIQRYRVQSMAGVPTMYVYLLNYPGGEGFDTSSVRVWGSGAAPLPTEIVEPFERKFGGKLMEGYGLTETSPVVSAHRLSGVRKLGSVGQPLPGVEVRILDDDGRVLAGEVGEACVRGANVMLGYYRMPEETAAVLRDGWLRTGDVGRLDADGFLYIERKKDLIMRGGFNIYPREVEEVLYAYPGIAEAAVVGARCADRRGGGGVRRREIRGGARSKVGHRLLRGASRPLQVPQGGPARGGATEKPDRENLEEGPARTRRVTEDAGPARARAGPGVHPAVTRPVRRRRRRRP
jgi:long-chain acyl-CoA synthetase